MFRLFVFSGVLVVIALFTALIAPYFVDWSVYKRDFEAQATRLVGQPVRVGGEASIRLLPLPFVRFGELSVGPDDKPLVTVEEFSARVEIAPLLSGEVRVVDMRLDRPHFNIEVDENGAIAWTQGDGLPVDPGEVALDQVTIRDASFLVTGFSSGSIRGDGISAAASAGSLYGPWRINGSGIINGNDTDFDIATGRLTDQQTMRLRTEVQQIEFPYTLRADGPVSVQEGVLTWNGDIQFAPASSNLTALNAQERERSSMRSLRSAGEALPVWISSRFEATPQALTIDDLEVEIGPREDPFVLTGGGLLAFRNGGQFRFELDGRQVDLARLAEIRGESTAQNLESRIALLRGILDQIPIPDMRGILDFEIPAIVSGDTMIREVSMAVQPDENRWQVDRFNAVLPGNTTVEFQGSVGRGDDFGFDGRLLVASRQPSGLAAWLGSEPDANIRRIGSAGIEADIAVTPRQARFQNMEIVLGDKIITGRVSRIASPNADDETSRPAIVAVLNGKEISIDELRALFRIVGEEDVIGSSYDLDLAIVSDVLTGFGLTARGVDVQVQADEKALSLSRFNVSDLFGVTVRTRGVLNNIFDGASGNIAIEVEGENLSAALAEAKARTGIALAPLDALVADPSLSSNSRLRVEIDAGGASQDARNALRYVGSGTVGETEIAFSGDLPATQFEEVMSRGFSLALKARSDDAGKLMRQTGLERFGFSPLIVELPQPLELNFDMRGSEENGFATSLSANAPDTGLDMRGVLYPVRGSVGSFGSAGGVFDGVNFQGEFTFGTGDVIPYLTSFGYGVSGYDVITGKPLPVSASGRLSRTDGEETAITIENAQWAGSAVKGELKAQTAGDGDLAVRGQLSLSALDAPALLATLLDVSDNTLPVDASGVQGPEGAGDVGVVRFGSLLAEWLDLDVKLSASQVALGVGPVATNLTTRLRVGDGSLDIDGVELAWLGGAVTGSASVSVADALVLQTSVSGNGLDLAALSQAALLPDVANGEATMQLSLEGAGRSGDALIGGLSGEGILSVTDGLIDGFTVSGMREIIAADDAAAGEDNAAQINAASLAANTFLSGQTQMSISEAPLFVRAGSLEMRSVPIAMEDGEAPSLSARYSLGDRSFSAQLTITPPIESLADRYAGAEPSVTFSFSNETGEVQRSIDAAGLETYLQLRRFENEQRRVEMLQASVLERQRLQNDIFRSQQRNRWLQAKIEAQKKREEEARQRALEEEQRRLEAEAERLRQQELARERKAEEERQRLEAERAAKEAAERAAREEAERAAQQRNQQQSKEGVEIRALPGVGESGPSQSPSPVPSPAPSSAPSAQQAPVVPRSLFDNIERLLTPQFSNPN